MRQRQLSKHFISLCRAYAHQREVLGFSVHSDKKQCIGEFIYRTCRLQILYRLTEAVGIPPSTVYCRIFPDKLTPIYLHIPQLLPLMGVEDYRAAYFPYIETPRRMAACFQALTEFWETLLPSLQTLARTGQDQQLLGKWVESEPFNAPTREILKSGTYAQAAFVSWLDSCEQLLLIRYTDFPPWQQYLMGNHRKAAALYRKKKQLSAYERGLLEFLDSGRAADFLPITPACFAAGDKAQVTRGKEDLGTIGLCTLAVYGMFAAVLCLIAALFQLISGWGTLCWLGMPWYSGFLFAGLPALFGGIALRRRLIPILFPKRSVQQLEFDDICSDTPFVRWFSAGAFAVCTAAAAVILFFCMGSCAQFYETEGVIHHSHTEVHRFSYDQIEAIYHIQSRYNVYGERIDRDSYVIATGDGVLSDLDSFASAKETRSKVLPILTKAGIPVVELDSDRELPQKEHYHED